MSVFGFTASRNLDRNGIRLIDQVLASVLGADLWVTGACIGGDQHIAKVGADADVPQRIYVPGITDYVDLDWIREMSKNPKVDVKRMSRRTTYRERNQCIVFGQSINMLIGFPQYAEDDWRSKRSGTWQTIRMAQKAGIHFAIHILEARRPS